MSTTERKVRLVRCPKCWGLLPEMARHPVYKCGGCGATLKAKKCKEGGQTVSSEPQDTSPTQKNAVENDSGSRDITLCPTKESKELNVTPSDDKDQSGVARISNSFVSSTEFNSCMESGESSCEFDGRINKGIDARWTNVGMLSPDGQSTYMAETPLDESIDPDMSSLIKQVEKFREIASSDSDHIRQTSLAETIDPSVDEMKYSDKLRGVHRYSTSTNYYAYDGSVSSYDGWDEEVYQEYPHLPKRTSFKHQRAAGFYDYGAESQARKLSSISLKQPSPVMMHNGNWDNWGRDGLRRHTRYIQEESEASQELDGAYPGDRFLPREPFYHRGSPSIASYENAGSGPSNYRHEEFPSSSSLYPSNKLDYYERNQMVLLKRVEELTDQINRSYAHNGSAYGSTYGRFSTKSAPQEKQWSVYHDHNHENEVSSYHNFNYPCHHYGEYQSRKPTPRQSGFLQMSSLSGKTTNARHHCDYSSSYGYHELSQCPLNFAQRGRDTNAKEKLHSKERSRLMKRHYRPLAGGAPFIICKKCSKLLQLPADFLLSNRRCHKLHCGSCSELLMFSLQDRTHIVSYTPNSALPPFNDDYTNGGPVSYSEDYGRSISKSSTDRDAAPTKQSRNKNIYSIEASSPSTNQIKRKISIQKKEELLSKTGPSLHSLMGYSSARDMMNKTAI
ncbi:hypothetical protein GIB67_041079 [Kingdonia uniflora]|uniref:Zinc-ribbon domain-containing protein n=1 Tax=Kingdonia uniflora TaxID=39325 RepID=A0A7J7LK15_9MAGN|nr:hypothetical protein GIB67_041079 [Kingdonia uniflora]